MHAVNICPDLNFVGQYRSLIAWEPDRCLRFKQRGAILDNEALRPMGKVSIML